MANMKHDIKNSAGNPGDRVMDDSKSIEEKAEELAVDVCDITGEHFQVPKYFVVEGESGDQKALHHVRDAEEISDVIRQARVDENGDRNWW